MKLHQGKTENTDSNKKDKVASKTATQNKERQENPTIPPKNKANMDFSGTPPPPSRAAGFSAGGAEHLHKNPPSSAHVHVPGPLLMPVLLPPERNWPVEQSLGTVAR